MDIEITASNLYDEFTEGCPSSAYEIYEIILQKFPHFGDWEVKQLHECSKSFLNEFYRDEENDWIDLELNQF